MLLPEDLAWGQSRGHLLPDGTRSHTKALVLLWSSNAAVLPGHLLLTGTTADAFGLFLNWSSRAMACSSLEWDVLSVSYASETYNGLRQV